MKISAGVAMGLEASQRTILYLQGFKVDSLCFMVAGSKRSHFGSNPGRLPIDIQSSWRFMLLTSHPEFLAMHLAVRPGFSACATC